ncbi:hypothetical protein [Halogeometricum limi]|uniref:Glucoamylase (Glucan-1,4-alpha-glucosidase), GH15 family n=1 Tax=Halogeometricum limi TaxID=555875 RepID=A0A1I6IEH0_9EURY|nr:hypothetical protein [Halogeometricum limi]SFR65029.1 hypothetical protein SAMN04488124_3132 [Halogeometricum limi]
MALRSLSGRFRTFVPTLRLHRAPEFFGPTDINAQSGNQRLSVALNREGTVTVLRWPRPSYYNHVGHHTTDRDEPRFGARPNEGSFLGLRVELDDRTEDAAETTWFRDWRSRQRYVDPRSDVVETTHTHEGFGLSATVTDVVDAETDVLVREVSVSRSPDSPVRRAVLLAFANVDVTVSKRRWSPLQDLRRRWNGDNHAEYHRDVGAVMFWKSGTDDSADEPQSVAVAFAFAGPCDAFHVGSDDQFPSRGATPADAYAVATQGTFDRNRSHTGTTTGLLVRSLDFETDSKADATRGDVASATVLYAAATTPSDARRVLADARGRSPDAVRGDKRAWFDGYLGDAPMPATDDPVVVAVAWRALVTLVTNYDPQSGAVVASIATQSPYAQDWPRDGAFCNHVLDRIGRSDWARKRNRWYASLQESVGWGVLGTTIVPAGNWAMNYYADGDEGGPIPWEIDQTALTVWGLWDHYQTTGAREYLREVYPAIRRAADFFVAYRDPSTGLHRAAHEDDNLVRSRTIVGASTVWLALDSAVRAATVLGFDADVSRFSRRRDELAGAIEMHLWNPADGAYTRNRSFVDRLVAHPLVPDAFRALPLVPTTSGASVLSWPARYADVDQPRMRRHLEHVWKHVSASFAEPDSGSRQFGMYETKALIALSKAWADDPVRLERVRDGVRWVAHEHATFDTHVLGEAWIRHDGDVVAAVCQPHTFTGLLFYYAALEAFGTAS